MPSRRTERGMALACGLVALGCGASQTLTLPTRLHLDEPCMALRTAAYERGFVVFDEEQCASVELAGQGRLVFEPPRDGRLDVTLTLHEARLFEWNRARRVALLDSEARIIVSLAEQKRGL